MLKLCGYHPGYCRLKGRCTFEAPRYLDKARWHTQAGQAFECVSFVPKDGHYEIRDRRAVLIRSKRKSSLVRPKPPRSRNTHAERTEPCPD